MQQRNKDLKGVKKAKKNVPCIFLLFLTGRQYQRSILFRINIVTESQYPQTKQKWLYSYPDYPSPFSSHGQILVISTVRLRVMI